MRCNKGKNVKHVQSTTLKKACHRQTKNGSRQVRNGLWIAVKPLHKNGWKWNEKDKQSRLLKRQTNKIDHPHMGKQTSSKRSSDNRPCQKKRIKHVQHFLREISSRSINYHLNKTS